MADSHSNDIHPDMKDLIDRLTEKARKMTEGGTNTIAAGAPNERVLFERQVGVFLVRRLPDDPDCLRLSIGAPPMSPGEYIVLRGDPRRAIRVLEAALLALRESGVLDARD